MNVPSKQKKKPSAKVKPFKPFPIHPLAELLPAMSEAEFQALVEDMRANGQRDPAVLLDGKILDGRHRQQAAIVIGQPLLTTEYKKSWGEPVDYVYSRAIHRNLSEGQKACAAANVLEARFEAGKKKGAANLKRGTVAPTSAQSFKPHNFNKHGTCTDPDVIQVPGVPKDLKASAQIHAACTKEGRWLADFSYSLPTGGSGGMPTLGIHHAFATRAEAVRAAATSMFAELNTKLGSPTYGKLAKEVKVFIDSNPAAKAGPGGPRECNDAAPGRTAEVGESLFGVSARSIAYARSVKKSDPKLFGDVFAGGIKLAVAVREVQRRAKKEVQIKAVKPRHPATAAHWCYQVGDNVELLPTLPRAKARLAIVDPQYNVGYDYGNGPKADSLPEQLYVDKCVAWMDELREVLTPDGAFWLIVSDEFAAELCVEATAIGFHRRAWVKWYETFGVNCSDNFNRTSRHLFYFVKDAKRFVFNKAAFNRPSARQVLYNDGRAKAGGKLWDDVWPIPRLVDNAKERLAGFPTQLPLDLVRPIVAGCSDPGDLVIDCCAGSGTVLHAALEQNRNAWGCDLDPKFVAAAKHRLAQVGREAASLDDAICHRGLEE